MEQPIPHDDLSELPLFPLNVVLFPGMRLPLHIFEERYKAMIGDCVRAEQPFGVVLIKEGPEVGGPAEPHSMGTSARIVQVQELEEGRLNILTRGERRFQVVEVRQQVPHLVGLVRYVDEEMGEVPPGLVDDVHREYDTFLRHLGTLAGAWNAPVTITEDPLQLSFDALATLTSSIELPQGLRQEFLETPNVQVRLEKLLPLLRRANELIQEQAAQNNPYRGPRLN